MTTIHGKYDRHTGGPATIYTPPEDLVDAPAAQLDTAEIRARALDNARTDSTGGRQPWRALTDDVPALCDEVDRLRAEVHALEEMRRSAEARIDRLRDRWRDCRDAREQAEAALAAKEATR